MFFARFAGRGQEKEFMFVVLQEKLEALCIRSSSPSFTTAQFEANFTVDGACFFTRRAGAPGTAGDGTASYDVAILDWARAKCEHAGGPSTLLPSRSSDSSQFLSTCPSLPLVFGCSNVAC